jgi:anti-sigma regulatory factor (Ser/Thr protein kinase)
MRAAVGTLLADIGWVDDESRTRVLLALSEVVANAVRHAYADAEPGDMEVSAAVDHGVLRVAVRDFGAVRLPSANPGLGVGLRIAERCADAVRVTSLPGGTTVELEFRR